MLEGANRMRGGTAKAEPTSGGRNTLERERLRRATCWNLSLNRLFRWRTLGWSKTLKTGLLEGYLWKTAWCFEDEYSDSLKNQTRPEKNTSKPNVKRGKSLGTTNGCPGGTKLWRVKPQERIRYEIRPVSLGRNEASGGLGKPEDAGG